MQGLSGFRVSGCFRVCSGKGGGGFRVDGSLRVLGLRIYGVLLRTVRFDGEV